MMKWKFHFLVSFKIHQCFLISKDCHKFLDTTNFQCLIVSHSVNQFPLVSFSFISQYPHVLFFHPDRRHSNSTVDCSHTFNFLVNQFLNKVVFTIDQKTFLSHNQFICHNLFVYLLIFFQMIRKLRRNSHSQIVMGILFLLALFHSIEEKKLWRG